MLQYRNWLWQTTITFNLSEAYIGLVESPCTVDSTSSNLRLLLWLDIGIVSILPRFLSPLLQVVSTPWVLYLSGYHTLFDCMAEHLYNCSMAPVLWGPQSWVTRSLADGLQQQGGPESVPPIYLSCAGLNICARLPPAHTVQLWQATQINVCCTQSSCAI
jgi:hypothetical protein